MTRTALLAIGSLLLTLTLAAAAFAAPFWYAYTHGGAHNGGMLLAVPFACGGCAAVLRGGWYLMTRR